MKKKDKTFWIARDKSSKGLNYERGVWVFLTIPMLDCAGIFGNKESYALELCGSSLRKIGVSLRPGERAEFKAVRVK